MILGHPKTETLTSAGWELLVAFRRQELDPRDAVAKTDACIRLGRAVVDQSVRDAAEINTWGLNPIDRLAVPRDARRWLDSPPMRALFEQAGIRGGDWRSIVPMLRLCSRHKVRRKTEHERMAG